MSLIFVVEGLLLMALLVDFDWNVLKRTRTSETRRFVFVFGGFKMNDL